MARPQAVSGRVPTKPLGGARRLVTMAWRQAGGAPYGWALRAPSLPNSDATADDQTTRRPTSPHGERRAAGLALAAETLPSRPDAGWPPSPRQSVSQSRLVSSCPPWPVKYTPRPPGRPRLALVFPPPPIRLPTLYRQHGASSTHAVRTRTAQCDRIGPSLPASCCPTD